MSAVLILCGLSETRFCFSLCRSILTYSRVGGRVKTLTFCQGSHYLAIASDNGAVQLLAIEASKLPKSPKIHPLQSRSLSVVCVF